MKIKSIVFSFKVVTMVILLSFISHCSFSQNLIDRLSESVPDCETISRNSQELIATYTISDYDSIQPILKIWKDECGNLEPIRRLEMLMDIYDESFSYSDHKNYLIHELQKFTNRVHNSKLGNNGEMYERSKSYYSYVKLDGDFDRWTRSVSKDLLELTNDKSSESYLMLLLFSEEIDGFHDAMYKTENRDLLLVKEYKKMIENSPYIFYKFCVYVGVWNPIGNLEEHFEKSPQLGVGINVGLKNNFSIEIKAIFTRFLNNKELEFTIDDRIVNVKPRSGMAIGINAAKEYSLLKDRAFIDLYSGINVAIIDSGIKKEKATDEDGTEVAETVNLEIGANFRKVVFKYRSIGVNLAVNYSPYNLDSQLKTEVGCLYSQANLFFRF